MTTSRAVPGQYLTFWLGGQEVAVGIGEVKEIIQHRAITPVPAAAHGACGVINLRGMVVPVFDLGAAFGQPVAPTSGPRCSIVFLEVSLHGERTLVGLTAGAVGRLGDTFVPLLDVERILSSPQLMGVAPQGRGNGQARSSDAIAGTDPGSGTERLRLRAGHLMSGGRS